MSAAPDSIRVDKWLWQARFFKTRSLAARVVSDGKVRVNATPISKPSRAIGPGDVLTFSQGREVRVIELLAIGIRRGPAPEAQALYKDLAPPQKRPPLATPSPGHDRAGRPTKRDRRAISRLEGSVFDD
ncbi:MAG: RNA-binding S4 domain-containing protein [Pseudomonadota bacterium]